MNLLNKSVDGEENGHQTRSWNELNPPIPGSGIAEQRVLRELIEKNSRAARKKQKRLFASMLTAALFVTTATIAVTSFSSYRPIITKNPALATPTTSDQFCQRADALVSLGRYDDALMDYSCLARLNRDNQSAHEGIALCYVETGRNTEAIDKLNDILSRYPDSISAHMLRGECYRNMHEFDKARADFSWLLQHDKNCSTAYCSMTDLLSMEGKREEALLYIDSAINHKIDNFQTRQRRAELLVSLGRFAEAENDFEAINKMPSKQENAETLACRSKAYLATGKFEKALTTLDKLITLRPKHVTPYMERAKAQFGLKNYSKAVKDCDQVLLLSKENPDALLLRADCFAQLGDKIAAINDYERSVAKNPKFTRGFLKLASYQMEQSNFASALSSYRSALSLNSNCAEALSGCQKAKQALESLTGNSQVAFNDSKTCIASDRVELKQIETLSFTEALAKGYAALRDGRCEFATRTLKRAVQLQPNSAEARRYLAFALMEAGDVLNAERQLQAVRQLNGEEPSDNIRLATAFQKSGRHDKAIAILQNHVRQYKTDVDAIVLLTDSLLTANERPRAMELCEQTMRLVSNPRDQERLREKFLALKNSNPVESGTNAQHAIDTSPLESRGS
ncbi:tetratricopeptide repeat protein [Candidatus Obscuribacterales bacterium]|nr:tetratricopeptide repeat protein [Candidatus Obscuribacterales bacterium]